MKIQQLNLYQVHLPYAHGLYRLSGGRTYAGFDASFVELVTDTGVSGWGESTPFGASYIEAHGPGIRAAMPELADAVLGQDPRRIDRINDAMDIRMTGQRAAKAAIDVALWDLLGKLWSVPVCDLLGGRTDHPIGLISSIGAGTPDEMAQRVAEYRARGFKGHSIKVGASEAEGGPALDAERIRASLSARQPGEWFLVDANGGLSVEHALRLEQLVGPELDYVLEAPCASWRETQSLRLRLQRPLLLDELAQSDADFMLAAANDLCDGVGIKITKQGGLSASRRQRDIARAAGWVMSVQDTVGSDIAFAAILHMAQTVPAHLLRYALDTRAMVTLKTAKFEPLVNADGTLHAPDQPGLGVTPDLDVLGQPVARFEL